jgi:hypothetical protein
MRHIADEKLLEQLMAERRVLDLKISELTEKINLARVRAKARMVRCQFCSKRVPVLTAHRHSGKWVGECCWEERLRVTE